MGQPSDWWRCRARDGGVGYLPSPYLETIQRRPQQAQIAANSYPASEASSRLHTMTGSVGNSSRTNSMKITDKEKAEVQKAPKEPPFVKGKPGDIPLESFQRGAFNS
jgi:peroxin-13